MKMLLKYRHNKGLTVIELMTAVVIIGVLAAIIGANFVKTSRERAWEGSMQNNMRTLQIMLETYRVDWEAYPENLDVLADEALDKKYLKSVANPYSGLSGPVKNQGIWTIDMSDLDAENPVVPEAEKNLYAGRVGYLRTNLTKYYLFGFNDQAEYITRKGEIYTVTNGEVE